MDPILITTLISTIFTSILTCGQMYLDYKRDKLNNHDGLYEVKSYQSNCCSTINESDDEGKK